MRRGQIRGRTSSGDRRATEDPPPNRLRESSEGAHIQIGRRIEPVIGKGTLRPIVQGIGVRTQEVGGPGERGADSGPELRTRGPAGPGAGPWPVRTPDRRCAGRPRQPGRSGGRPARSPAADAAADAGTARPTPPSRTSTAHRTRGPVRAGRSPPGRLGCDPTGRRRRGIVPPPRPVPRTGRAGRRPPGRPRRRRPGRAPPPPGRDPGQPWTPPRFGPGPPILAANRDRRSPHPQAVGPGTRYARALPPRPASRHLPNMRPAPGGQQEGWRPRRPRPCEPPVPDR